MRPDTIPNKLEDKINYKIVFLIIASAASFQIFIYFLDKVQQDLIISTVSIINPLIASISGFTIAHRYKSSKTFGNAYLALGCGYLSATFGEVLYFVFVLLEIETFPSLIDVFFFVMYPFILIHLIVCIRFFKPKMTLFELIWIILIPIVITTIYITSSYEKVEEIDLGFYFGIVYAVEPAIVLPLAILGAKVFRGGIIGTSWIILVLAIITLTIGDVWYSYLEVFNMYDLTHPVNIFWYAGYWLIVYALYKHKKSI
ncbi:MAG TPA: histidine kinase [Candidatus Nitrosotenuis sp.]|nr:histidine kinase [Candidatus Nitrosotenuis sp.]